MRAGSGHPTWCLFPLAEASEEALLRAFDVNVAGAHRLVAAAFPRTPISRRVAIVQPGSFRSGLVTAAGSAVGAPAQGSPFFRQVEMVRGMLVREWERGMAPEQVARVVVRALLADRPRARYRVGNNRLRVLLRFLPTRAADAVIKLVIR